MKSKPSIIFTKESLPFILRAFGKSINEDGIIITEATGEPQLTPEGEELTLDQLGAIKKGSELFLKDDIYSTIQLTDGKY